MERRVRTPDGWTTVELSDVDDVTVTTGKTDDHLLFTLIGIWSGAPNVLVRDVLDVAPLSNPVPRTADGTSIPIAQSRLD